MKRCVYTALYGSYEELNEQPFAHKSEIPFICFTDDPNLKSDTWQIRNVSPLFFMDPVRSQRHVKLQPHKHLPEYDLSIYIDNSVILTAKPDEIINQYIPASGFHIFQHSYRETVLDEFLEVAKLGFDDQNRVFEQLNHYSVYHPDILHEKPYWGGLQIRDHKNPAVCEMLDIWFSHVLRYSRRDQLSANISFKLAKMVPDVINESNHSSWFHSWGKFINRNRNRGAINPFAGIIPTVGRLRQLEQEIDDKISQIAEKDNQINELLNSLSWKITSPLRSLAGLFPRKKK